MLFAWQIGNPSTTSLAVQNSTVSCSLYQTGEFTHSVEDPKIEVGFDFIIKFPDKLS